MPKILQRFKNLLEANTYEELPTLQSKFHVFNPQLALGF